MQNAEEESVDPDIRFKAVGGRGTEVGAEDTGVAAEAVAPCSTRTRYGGRSTRRRRCRGNRRGGGRAPLDGDEIGACLVDGENPKPLVLASLLRGRRRRRRCWADA